MKRHSPMPMSILIPFRFQQLTQAKDFLLDPYQRRAFNEAHGFLTPTVNVAWWPAPQSQCPSLEQMNDHVRACTRLCA